MLTRRQFLSAGILTALSCCASIEDVEAAISKKRLKRKSTRHIVPKQENDPTSTIKLTPTKPSQEEFITLTDEEVKDYLFKMRNFDKPFPNDIILQAEKKELLNSSMKKFRNIQSIVGHGKFYLLGIDDAISIARNSNIGSFSNKELLFLEELFYVDASKYGFMDTKPLTKFTDSISQKEVYKVPNMGNYIYKGLPQKKWEEVKKIVGKDLILTSGVRGIIKQFYLFLAKAQKHEANLSLASRSLAPPGYSFHGIGDFDVGQRGFGIHNFTAEFTSTKVYKLLSMHGYLSLRYPKDNFLGVRFEPWHIKAVSS